MNLKQAPRIRCESFPGYPALGRAGGSHLKVLVIEDNLDAAETLGDLLSLFGHETEVALSGPAGVETARSFRPEVVLCDIGLPGMDGYAVARSLRGDPAMRSARLIALTGYGRETDRQRTQEAGFDLHLVKPVEPLELKRLLEDWATRMSESPEPAA
ncbi:MAG TPA: response regulator [Thermoanaerobaculia bacterium]|nr:response regulator [Thermoanaerobaculia bacterium]